MKTKILLCGGMLLFAVACGDKNNDVDDDNVISGNVRPNNDTNNASNNTTGTNNPTNSATNNPTNNGMNNPTNNATNNPTNNATNNPTNNATNNGTNNNTNNMTLGPAETGTATVDIAVTMNARSVQMTSCDWMDGTALAINYNTHPSDGSLIGLLSCTADDPENANGFFIVDLLILDEAVGTNAGVTMFVDCGANGCSGNSEISVGYYDLAMNTAEEVSTATSSMEGGNMVISSYDTATAELEGQLDLVITEGPLRATLIGDFSADLADCTGRDNCVGDGM